MAGEPIQATRVPDPEFIQWDDPNWRYWRSENGWFLNIPGCGLAALSKHDVTEHEDGTISVQPSIKTTGHRAGTPVTRHGFLTRGVWHPCDDDAC